MSPLWPPRVGRCNDVRTGGRLHVFAEGKVPEEQRDDEGSGPDGSGEEEDVLQGVCEGCDHRRAQSVWE